MPSHGGFTFNHYIGADLSEYDLFIIPSEGSVDKLEELGARELIIVFWVDTDVYAKMQLAEDRSVVFLGMVSRNRENNIKITIIEPGLKLGGSYCLIQDKKISMSTTYLTKD